MATIVEPRQDGLDAETLFGSGLGLTFDDLIVLPGYIDFPASDVRLETHVTRNIRINRPIVSSPMDTETEAQMANMLALNDGVGILHDKNNIYDQVELARQVRRSANGLITDPVPLSPE